MKSEMGGTGILPVNERRGRSPMRRPRVIALTFLFLASTFSFAMVPPAPVLKGSTIKAKDKRIVVRFRSESATGITHGKDAALAGQLKTLPNGLGTLHTRFGVKSLHRVGHETTAPKAGSRKFSARAPQNGSAQAQHLRRQFNRTAVLDLSPGTNISQALADYRSNPDVEWAEPVHVFQIQGVPNDPSFASLWGMTKIQAPSAWDLAQGNGVVVAVVDTGVDHTHPDLAANIWANPDEISGNGIDDDGNGYVDDVHGWNFVSNSNAPLDGHSHGTHVSGTIAAVGNNGLGVIGVAPLAKIMAVKGLGDDGSGYDTDLAQGIVYAADNGADIINMSWGGTGDSPVIEEAIQYAYSLGVILVAAAGNSAIDASQFLPAKYAGVITVSAFNSADTMASFSNFGTKIDVAAPGVGIQSTVPGGFYSSYNGTSMASPHVAGLAALILSQHPGLTNEQVRQVIRRTADDVGAVGFDTQAGYGRINTLKALQAASPPNLVITFPAQFAPLSGSVDVRGSAEGTALATRRLEYGVGVSPSTFLPIGPPSSGHVTNGSLGTWDVTALVEGLYSLRLAGTDAEGTSSFFTVSPVRVDRTGPQILSVSPANGASLPASPLTVSASATDDYGIARLQFKVDGVAVSVSSPTEPTNVFTTSFVWNAAAAGAGSHALEVSAFDLAGNKTTRAMNVTVINDTTPPTVALTAPAPNTDIAGTVAVEANASDNVEIQHVLFSLDGSAPFGTDAVAPYRATLSTLGIALGPHTLTATAVDASHLHSTHTIIVNVIADVLAPVLSNVNVTVLNNDVQIIWTTDEPSDSQVEYGTSSAFGLTSPLPTAMTLTHQVDLTNLPPNTLYVYRVLSRDNVGNLGMSSTGTFTSSDEAPPLGGITSPAPGAVVSGMVTVSGSSSDENAMTRVDLLFDGHYWTTVFGAPPPQANISTLREREPEAEPVVIPQAQTTTWTYALDTTQLSDGPHVLIARSFDGADHSQDATRSLSIQNGSTMAQYDPVLGAPLCSHPGAVCASGGLLEARSTLDQFPEPHHPNTVLGGCDDGSSGRYHTDESNDWIRVTSLNGGPLKAGTLARVDAKVWAYSTKNNYLDLYVTADMSHPVWTLITTLRPDTTRSAVLSSTFTLPTGGEVQAVRANFRYQGSAGACSAGDYDDHDDLAFAVERADVLPPTVSAELHIGDFFAKPNPVTGNAATLRVEVENADRISQKIYSLTGQLVLEDPPTEIRESLNGWQALEASWSTNDVAAGTYYWTVEAEKEGKKVRDIRKLAVVK